MRAAVLAPTGLLERYAYTDYHLCLAHMVLGNDDYSDFYAKRAAAGDFVILDNSVIELGYPMETSSLIEACERIHPSELVACDFREDPEKTYNWVKTWGPEFKNAYPEMKIMVVPQWRKSKIYSDWWASFLHLRDLDCVDTFGIPKFLRGARSVAINNLDKAPELRAGKEYHLLGTWGNPFEVKWAAERSWIRGVDSKAPVRFGQYGVVLDPDLGLLAPKLREALPDLDFNNADDPVPRITEHNVVTFINWAVPKHETIPPMLKLHNGTWKTTVNT